MPLRSDCVYGKGVKTLALLFAGSSAISKEIGNQYEGLEPERLRTLLAAARQSGAGLLWAGAQ
jgi:hypothetical protein